MKSIIVVAGLAVAAIGSAQAAPFGLPQDVGIRAGVVLPINSDFRDQGNTLFGIGVDIPVTFTFSKEAQGVISVDYFASNFGGGHGSALPILFNERFYGKPLPGQPRSYFFVGGGMAFVDISSSNLVLAGRVGVGTEFNTNLYGEAALNFSAASAGSNDSSVGLWLGYRF